MSNMWLGWLRYRDPQDRCIRVLEDQSLGYGGGAVWQGAGQEQHTQAQDSAPRREVLESPGDSLLYTSTIPTGFPSPSHAGDFLLKITVANILLFFV